MVIVNNRLYRILFDVAVACVPVVAAAALYKPIAVFRDSSSVYVSKQGSDWNGGRTAATALATIQSALDQARPGDQILVGPGTYYERLHLRKGGTEIAPVSVVATTPGSVIISGKLPEDVPREWAWRDDGRGIYSTAIRHPVYRLNHGSLTCFRVPWGGLAALRDITSRPGAWSAFCEEKGRLYVYLKGGKHPALEELSTHRPAPAPREWGEFKSATLWVEADHVRLDGLQFDFGIGAAVNIWNAEHVEFNDCVFSGCTFGVKCSGGTKPSRHIRIVNCLYHNYPQYHWHKDWLTWGEVYAAYASSTLASSTDAPLLIQECLVTHSGDALRISPHAGQGTASAMIDGNQIAYCTDDAIEFDGDGSQIDVRNNLVHEAHQNLGFSPVGVGPITVQHNLFAHLQDGINGSQIKLINNKPGERIRNISIRDNVFIGDWLCWYNDAPVSKVTIENNRFFVYRQANPPWPIAGVDVGDHQVELRSDRLPPEQTLAAWYHNANNPLWMRAVLDRRHGPSWFRAEDHPATKDATRWKSQLRQLLQTVESH